MKMLLQVAVAAGLTVAAIVATIGAGRAGDVVIEAPWVRLTIPGRPAAGFLTIRNAGTAADRLTAAASPQAERIEVHAMTMTDGVMKMFPVEAVDVPAGGMAELKSGGFHLMLFGLDPALMPGDLLALKLTFENAGEVTAEAEIRGMGNGMGHGSSGHGTATQP